MARRLALLCALGFVAAMTWTPSALAGGGCHVPMDVEMSTGTDPLVGIGECAFIDTVVYIEPGEEVTWVNKDPVPHTVTGAAYSWGTDRLLEQSQRVSYTFKEEGVFPYYCALHPSMVGAVVVGDATKAATVTNGVVDVDDSTNSGGGAAPATQELESEPVSDSGVNPGASAAIGIAIVATILVVGVASRTFALRRREPSVTPVP